MLGLPKILRVWVACCLLASLACCAGTAAALADVLPPEQPIDGPGGSDYPFSRYAFEQIGSGPGSGIRWGCIGDA